MENYEMRTLAVHVDEGPLSGPVVNSPRQLWSVAGYLSMVLEGVFGVEADGSVSPKLPVALVPKLFGKRSSIELDDGSTRYVLKRPRSLVGELLVAGNTIRNGNTVTVQLSAAPSGSAQTRMACHYGCGTHAESGSDTPRVSQVVPTETALFAPSTPAAPKPVKQGSSWAVSIPANHQLWQDGKPVGSGSSHALRDDGQQHCLSFTRREGALESLHSPMTCVGTQETLPGATTWRHATASPARVRIRLRYDNPNGPINTGVTAAVKQLAVQCPGVPDQRATVVMPHSVGPQDSTAAEFDLPKGTCTFTLEPGFNMSALEHFAQYNGGKGGRDGVLNAATVSALLLAPVAANGEAAR
jgi:hypothetical protein